MIAAAQAVAEAALRDSTQRHSRPPRDNVFNPSVLEGSEVSLVHHLVKDDPQVLRTEGGFINTDRQGVEDYSMNASSAHHIHSLLEMVQQQEHHELAAAAAEAAITSRPDYHYLTVARNGTILGVTETITGFLPEGLFMTSVYDAIYEEDIEGYHAIKTYLWDKDRPDAGCYHRKRTLEGKWLWVVTKVVSLIDQPVPGFVLLESRVEDVCLALRMNRITRISAILAKTVEEARSIAKNETETSLTPKQNPKSRRYSSGSFHFVVEDQSQLAQSSPSLPDPQDDLVLKTSDGFVGSSSMDTAGLSAPGGDSSAVEALDPFSTIEPVTSGICLDLGMIRMQPSAVTIVTHVLTGRLPVEDLAHFVLAIIESPGCDLDGYGADCEDLTKVAVNQKESVSRDFVTGARQDSHGERPPASERSSLWQRTVQHSPPLLSVLNLSYTYMGNAGLVILSEILYMDNSVLKMIDISFCGVDEKGILALCKAISKRRKKGLPPLQGLVLSGNYISCKAATCLGIELSERKSTSRKTGVVDPRYDGPDDEESDDIDFVTNCGVLDPFDCCLKGNGLQILRIGSASLSALALNQLLERLGPHCPIRELHIPSNKIGPSGATLLVDFLEGHSPMKSHPVMPFLDRLDLSNNNFGDDGTAKLTRAISKRVKVNLIDLRLSSNGIGSGGVETIMNKLLQHNLVSLSLDKNAIGDQGCQLVAASLPSMHELSRLNLSFNQIGSRGVNTLMRTLVGCESIRYLGLSGNIMKISGAIAMGFTLAQHPRLEGLDLDNCCLSQAAQCHIVAGVISNRWVPMKRMNGFQVGPPMVAIGALDVVAQHLNNDECFRLRRDEQMKTILQWMETNRAAKLSGGESKDEGEFQSDSEQSFLTPDFVSSINDVHGAPSQSAYLRVLGWLSQIPFDEEELTFLRKYFYDVDGGDGDRGSDGYINLKVRGDLLAALSDDMADEIREAHPMFGIDCNRSVGLDLSKNSIGPSPLWKSLQREQRSTIHSVRNCVTDEKGVPVTPAVEVQPCQDGYSSALDELEEKFVGDTRCSPQRVDSGVSSVSVNLKPSLCRNESNQSNRNKEDRKNFNNALKPRISVFSAFEVKLEKLKAAAQEMMDQEDDPSQQDIILTQYAEASLTILRQLRYHCMNSGFDGWRQGGIRRKVLIVDDSKVTRKMVSRAFEKANFIVDTAENGVEGVEKLKESIYDIVFMDIDMPVMNGFEATKTLRQWEDAMRPGARQPICALTAAYVDDFERSELMKFKEAGLDVMESKPCNIPRLFKVVDDVSPMFSDLSISLTQKEPVASYDCC